MNYRNESLLSCLDGLALKKVIETDKECQRKRGMSCRVPEESVYLLL